MRIKGIKYLVWQRAGKRHHQYDTFTAKGVGGVFVMRAFGTHWGKVELFCVGNPHELLVFDMVTQAKAYANNEHMGLMGTLVDFARDNELQTANSIPSRFSDSADTLRGNSATTAIVDDDVSDGIPADSTAFEHWNG